MFRFLKGTETEQDSRLPWIMNITYSIIKAWVTDFAEIIIRLPYQLTHWNLNSPKEKCFLVVKLIEVNQTKFLFQFFSQIPVHCFLYTLKNWWMSTVLHPDTIESKNPDPGGKNWKKKSLRKPWKFFLKGWSLLWSWKYHIPLTVLHFWYKNNLIVVIKYKFSQFFFLSILNPDPDSVERLDPDSGSTTQILE